MTFVVESCDLREVVSGVDDPRQAAAKALQQSDAEWLGALLRVRECYNRAKWHYFKTAKLLEPDAAKSGGAA